MKRGVKTKTGGSIRIISGQWRGRKIPVLDVQGLRPTTDRNKETLFNWLMPYIHNARCLDVFAGSGGLGFESLSRYAEAVTFIELNKQAALKIQSNLALLQVQREKAQVINGDANQVLTQLSGPFDLIFLDPPFHQNLLPKVLQLIEQQNLLAEEGLVYIETEPQAVYSVPSSWSLLKEKASSQLMASLYQKD